MQSIKLITLILTAAFLPGQTPVTIQIHADKSHGPFPPVWSYFGYDEANYTYTKDGRKLIQELASLSQTPPRIRTHFLLATGNATPGLKWSSTNAYTEDPSGHPTYNWQIVDRILSTYLDSGAKPLVEIGFMPQALSSNPDPYQPTWIPGAKNDHYSVGWTYPPKDYSKWGELIYQWVKHSVEKYGKAEVETWQWEVWNEPDISYWHGTPEEYDRLYDYAAAAVKRALPTAKVGGPATTSPRNAKAAAFLKQFLEHCATTGAPLDFITFHAKGQPVVTGQQVEMGIAKELQDASAGFEIVKSFLRFRNLPIILSEADPEGCAACSAQVYPQNAYRNGTLYPTYVAAAMKSILELATQNQLNLQGILTWAFEFEDQPYFAGFRDLATNGIDKPVLNVFRMAGLMTGDRVDSESTAALPLDAIVANGVKQSPDIDAIATCSTHTLSAMIWNYQDPDGTGDPVPITVTIDGLPKGARRILVHHYAIDQDHSNAYTTWKQLGSPQHPTNEQYSKLEFDGQLQLLESPRWIDIETGTANLHLSLASQSISLIQLTW